MTTLAASDLNTQVDESVSIKHLYNKHRAEIDELKRLAPPPATEVDGTPGDGLVCKYDDLFYLRYVLSFPGDQRRAAEAVKFNFDYRASEAHIKRIKKCCTGEVKNDFAILEAEKWNVAGPLGIDENMNRIVGRGVLKENTGEGFVIVVRIGLCKQEEMVNSLTFDEQKGMQLLHREAGFQYVDKLTRSTGLLCKQVLFFDLKGASLSSMNDSRLRGIQAEVSNIGKKCYPQLVDKLAIVNAPSWFAALLKVMKAVLPKSTLEKIELFSSTDSLWSSEWACRRLNRTNMPCFLGGNLPDSELTPQLSGKCLHETPLPCVSLKPRGRESVPIVVSNPGKHVVKYLVSVLNRSVSFAITFVPRDANTESKEATVMRVNGKIEASNGPIRDSLIITRPGTLNFIFDNSHSMMREKKIKYIISIEPKE